MRRRIHHQEKAFFGSGELGKVVFGMSSANVLLHRAIPLLLFDVRTVSSKKGITTRTPRQRFRHADPSWFLSGQTTSLPASVTEKEP